MEECGGSIPMTALELRCIWSDNSSLKVETKKEKSRFHMVPILDCIIFRNCLLGLDLVKAGMVSILVPILISHVP